MKFPVLFAVIALSSICASAHAAGGTIQFSGRIADPPCAAGQAAENSNSIQLQRCPFAAAGAQISVQSLQAGESVALGNDDNAGVISHLRVPGSNDSPLWFSQSYQLASNGRGVAMGDYVVRIDYP